MHDTTPAPPVKGTICPPHYWFILPELFEPGEFLRDPRDFTLFDDTRYLIYNKKALAITATGILGNHLLTLTAARPEGHQRRQTFRGNGAQHTGG